MATLEIAALSKTFQDNDRSIPALSDINFRATPGEFISIIGPSGCGKSTLFNIIVGLEKPDQGYVKLDSMPVEERAGLFGYMPQRDLLLPWRSILDNVILGPELAGENLATARQEATDMLPLFGLDGFGNVYPSNLSGGMRQRAALLRTFLCHRDIMLLDEPFGALDALTRLELQRWLMSIWQRFHKTILFITHDVDEALLLSDRVLVLSPRPGRLVLDLEVGMPRPRSETIHTTAAFAQQKIRVLGALSQSSPS
jgi:ABC-type nitrate/sulfonate/bicarbonate transport system ATPase subunit